MSLNKTQHTYQFVSNNTKMKTYRIYILSFIAILASTFAFAQEENPLHNSAFQNGEYLKYKVHYGFVNAGTAELHVKGKEERHDREVYHIKATGKSLGFFNLVFKVRDYYETYLDTEDIVPLEFKRDVREGGYKKKQHVFFDHENHLAKSNKKTIHFPYQAQDLLSSFYYLRCTDVSDFQPGDSIKLNAYLDDEIFPTILRYKGMETIDSKFGDIKCMKFLPILQEGRVFDEDAGMTIWVSADENLIPIRLETKVLVGSIKMDIIEYKNLRNPIDFK